MAERMRLTGRSAIVTGAASGIGRGVALALARRGCHLALADVNASGLDATAALVGNAVRVTTHRIDLRDADAIAVLPRTIADAHGGVDVLVNNAGVALGGTFDQVSDADVAWLFDINFWSVVRMTRAFMPMLTRSDDACIANVSSVFGLIAPAGQVAYAASKFAVRGFTEALRHELAGTRVAVTVVHPGGVATSIADNARVPADAPADEVARRRAAMNRHLRMPPERAGEIIVRGIERRKRRILVGADAVALSLLARLMPASYWSLLSRGYPR